MNEQQKEKTIQKKKGFFTRFFEDLDKKLEEKSKNSSCCSGQNDSSKGKRCC